jgi:toxin-antitoxin system PIN domain toxin
LSATVDTNILLYAANVDDEVHSQARELLERLARGPDMLYLFWPTIMGFLRIATHPAIFPAPMAPAEAIEAMTALHERPKVRAPGEQMGFWELYLLAAGQDTRANHVPDAQLAALMRQHGVKVIYTRDRDLRRYEGIEPRDPFA